jgi:uncharacterized protein (DUF433 family)
MRYVEVMAVEIAPRITVDPEICFGKPCIRGLRIRVSDVLDMLAGGASQEEVLRDFPYLEREDLSAALKYAAHVVGNKVAFAAE